MPARLSVTQQNALELGSPSWLPQVALIACYGAFPALSVVSRLLGASYQRSWIDLLWVGCLPLLPFLRSRAKASGLRPSVTMIAIAVILAATAAGKLLLAITMALPVDRFALLLEVKPLVYLLIAGALVSVGALPRLEDWVACGVVLALLTITDTILVSSSEGTLSRPYVSGEVNYDAFLLAIVLGLAGLDERTARTRRRRVSLLVIFIALLLTQSRTGLVAAMMAYIAAARAPLHRKALALTIGVAGALTYSIVRGLTLDLEAIDRYWMWTAGTGMLKDPLTFTMGAIPGHPHAVDIPPAIAALWDAQTQSLALSGVYPFNLHAFWLRAAVSYGAPAVVALAIGCTVLVARADSPRPLKYIIVFAAAAGFTMGTVYLSNVGVPLLLAIHQASLRSPYEPARSGPLP